MPLSVGFAGLCVLALCTALSIGQDLQHLSNENVGDTVEYNIRGKTIYLYSQYILESFLNLSAAT